MSRDPRARKQKSGKARRSSRGARRDGRTRPGGGQPRKAAPRRRGWLKPLAIWSLVLAIWGAVAAGGLVVYYAHDLPEIDQVAEASRKPSVTLLARDGTRLATYGDLYGARISLADLPKAVPQAVLAVEDRRFYHHPGIDPFGLARAALANLRAGEIVQGGSTITQQLAKNLFLTPKQTIKRKVQEAILAFWLEYRFTKDEILALYLNRVYLGAGTYGVDAAARRYFDKPARQVTLYEAAMLAGLLKAPSRYNPAADPEAARERARIVLEDMVAAGYITRAEAEQAARRGAAGTRTAGWHGRYFADWVLGEVRDYVGYHDADLRVHTTLDPRIQRIAAQQLRRIMRVRGPDKQAGQAALVTMAPNGAVRAMMGGRSYARTQFNRATQAKRQPGSAFKPFVYLTAMEETGIAPDTKVVDEPITVGGWSPDNYAGRYYGRVTLREAFARSLNSVAVKLIARTGPADVAETAERLGIASDLTARPSLALGTSEVTLLELTGAYAAFANRGRGVFPFGVRKIVDADGRVLYRRSGGGPGRVVQPRALRRMTDLLRANVVWGTGQGAQLDRPAAGKTGTSQGFRDAWFVGFTAELVTGVWTGNDDGAPMDGVTGGDLPATIWRETMRRALDGVPAKPLPGLEVQVADTARGRQPPAPADSGPSADAADGEDHGGGLVGRILRSLGAGEAEVQGASEETWVDRNRATGNRR
jgi:penicillin-binding protein 1A